MHNNESHLLMCTVPWSHMTMKWMTGLLLRGCCAPPLRADASTQVNIISQVGHQSRGDQAFALERCRGSVDGSVMKWHESELQGLLWCSVWIQLFQDSKLLNSTTLCPETVILYIIRLNFNLRCCWIWWPLRDKSIYIIIHKIFI